MHLTSDSLELSTRGRLSVAWPLSLVGALLWLIFELDRRTGSAPAQHLYYLPIILASLRIGRRAGFIVSIAAVALYHVANLAHFTASYTDTDVVQTVLFVVVAIVTSKLAEDGHRLRRLAATDDLTGLHNLRSFEAQLAAIVARSRETRTSLAMLVLDVDRLKSMNDVYGHIAGAEAVRLVGHTIAARLPADAVACRYGGDEFAIVVAHCDGARARAIAEELRGAVHALAPVIAGVAFPARTLSISIGVAWQHDDPRLAGASPELDVEAGEALFASADKALYLAKARGRNRVSAIA